MNYISQYDSPLEIAIQVLENRLEELTNKYYDIYRSESKDLDEFFAIQTSLKSLRNLDNALKHVGTDLPL